MAAPTKQGLHYFNLDCNLEDNIAFIKAKHGLVGWATVVELWRKIYKLHGYYCDFTEKNAYIFAQENGLDIGQLMAIIETCMDEGIFSRAKYDQFQILTSHGVQKRYLKIVTEAKRKNCKIDERYNLLKELIPEETPVNTGINQPDDGNNTGNIPVIMAQKKVKESNLKESISPTEPISPKETLPATPAGAAGETVKGSAKKKQPVGKAGKPEKPPRQNWQALLDAYFDWYKKEFPHEPNLRGRNSTEFGKLLDLLELRARRKKGNWADVQYAVNSLLYFLRLAIKDQWLHDHLTPENLVKQFDPVFARESQGKKSKTPVAAKSDRELRNEAIVYLIDRCQDLDFDPYIAIDPVLYDHLYLEKRIDPEAFQRFPGDTIQEKKILAVQAYVLKQAKNKPTA